VNEQSWRAATIVAMVLCVLLLAFHLFVPRQRLAANTARHQADELKLMQEVKDLRDRVSLMQTVNATHVSQGPGDSVGAEAMATVSNLAKTSNLKLIAFRPQRPQIDGVLTRNAYLAALEGPYPNVVRLVNTIEKSSKKLAVQSMQLASADGATDKVTASVTVVAYVESEAKAK
jgi:Tfp pilus assembly protein PilO